MSACARVTLIRRLRQTLCGVGLLALTGWSQAYNDPLTPWPTELTQYYMTQCQHGLRQQGDGPTKANTICGCMAAGLSKEFGMEEFEQMRTARLDPKGSFHDQRFFRVADACYKMYRNPTKRLN
jgi:hypothetical protein